LLFQNTTVTLYLLCGAPWFATIPPIDHGMMILLAAALATLSQLLMGWAYARAPASYLAPTEFTAFIWAALFGWIFFSETLAGMTILGAALIIGACLLAAGSKPEPFAASEGAI
jgi:S-adenosylmethionine uptake transporter